MSVTDPKEEIIITSDDIARMQADINQVQDKVERYRLQCQLNELKRQMKPVGKGPRTSTGHLKN